MGLEDKELGDDLLVVHFFMEKDSSYMMFEAEHIILRSDVIQKISSPKHIQKSQTSFFLFLNSN